jgi:hypothetical protein
MRSSKAGDDPGIIPGFRDEAGRREAFEDAKFLSSLNSLVHAKFFSSLLVFIAYIIIHFDVFSASLAWGSHCIV